MATAKKCDICGRLYESYNIRNLDERTNAFMLLNLDNQGKYYSHGPYDCCPDCMSSIRLTIYNLKKDLET